MVSVPPAPWLKPRRQDGGASQNSCGSRGFLADTNYRLNPGLAYAPAEPVWTYTAPTPGDFYAPYISGAQRLPNGNTLICDGVHGTLFEVTPAGKTVWKYVNPTTGSGPLRQGEPVPTEQLRSGREVPANQVYRAYRYAPDYPGLQGLDLTPGEPIELYDTP